MEKNNGLAGLRLSLTETISLELLMLKSFLVISIDFISFLRKDARTKIENRITILT